MPRKTQTDSQAVKTTVTDDWKQRIIDSGWKQRLVADTEKRTCFLSRITADAECFMSRIHTTLQEFSDGEVRELGQKPVISARLGKLSADDVKVIYRYIHSGCSNVSSTVHSPNQNHIVTGSLVICYETDEIVGDNETYIIREVSNLFVHTADEVEGHELGHALLVFKDEANPNFAYDRGQVQGLAGQGFKFLLSS